MTAAISLAGAPRWPGSGTRIPADIGRALDLGCARRDRAERRVRRAGRGGGRRLPLPAGRLPVGGRGAGRRRPAAVPGHGGVDRAVAEIAATLAVPGVDGIYVGPRDLSLSLGCALDPRDPVLRPALERVWAACAAAGQAGGRACHRRRDRAAVPGARLPDHHRRRRRGRRARAAPRPTWPRARPARGEPRRVPAQDGAGSSRAAVPPSGGGSGVAAGSDGRADERAAVRARPAPPRAARCPCRNCGQVRNHSVQPLSHTPAARAAGDRHRVAGHAPSCSRSPRRPAPCSRSRG